jgi:RNA polymerase sigma-70 factor, ECF subfamily
MKSCTDMAKVEPKEQVHVMPEERHAAIDTPSSLRGLYEEHAPFVCRILRRLSVPEAELDDGLQEVFLVVSQRLADYRERGKARAWLYSICRRVAQAQGRKRTRRREELKPEITEGEMAATQLRRLEDAEALLLGERVLAMLSPEQREVFVLYEVEDMPMSEVADALGCPLQTAYSRLHKARSRILSEVERLRDPGEAQ